MSNPVTLKLNKAKFEEKTTVFPPHFVKNVSHVKFY